VGDRDRHRRHDQIGAIARNQQVDLVDVDQLRVDARHQRGIALVVVIDQLDRPAEQTALGIDLVFPNLESEQPGLANDGERTGQLHAEANLDGLRCARGRRVPREERRQGGCSERACEVLHCISSFTWAGVR
jgi:hypothetical protein